MQKDSNNTTPLLDVESVEDERYPQQPEDLPPPYDTIAGLSSVPNQSVSGQSSVGNYHAPGSNQPPPKMYYGYTHLHATTGQPTLSGDVSSSSTGQIVYLIPADSLPANSSQPLIIGQSESLQSQPLRTEPRNTMVSSHLSTALPASSNQPLNYSQYRTSQSQPTRTPAINMRASRSPRTSELDSNDDVCGTPGSAIFRFLIIMIIFILGFAIFVRKSSWR